jgi:phosphoribosylanthranilate isomerase
MRIKICGIMKPDQGAAIVQLGIDSLGFICVPSSPRYVTPAQIATIGQALPAVGYPVKKIGVFANADLGTIAATLAEGQLTGIQLHGDESIAFCQQARINLPGVELIKAIRVRDQADLERAKSYSAIVDYLLLDAYHPEQLGGTGQAIDWAMLAQFQPDCPWLLAGGLRPDNIAQALAQLKPNGVDLSSGVEHSPGDKDLQKVALLVDRVRTIV